MNELLAHPINKDRSKKIFKISMLLFCLLPVVINCVALVPLYVSMSANALYSSSALTVIIKYVQDFFDLCAFSVSYALIIFSVLLISKKQARTIVLIYTCVFLLKIPLTLAMNVFLYGTLGSATDIALDVTYMLVYFALAMIQLFIVYWFATTDTNKYLKSIAFIKEKNEKNAKRRKGSQKKDVDKDEIKLPTVLPLTKFISWYNPLQRSAIKMGIFIAAIKIFSRLLNDITFGAPQSFGEVMIMVVYYLSDLLYGVIAYIISLLVFTAIYDKLKKKDRYIRQIGEKRKTDEEDTPSVLED